MSSPEEIQREIDMTRSTLSLDVDRLTDKLSPSRAVSRRADRLKGAAASARARVMGTPTGSSRSAGSGLASAKETVRSRASTVADTAARAPEAVGRQAQGNPLAAGLIAFGAGWLLGSLLPATEQEQMVARRVEEKAGELSEPIKHAAQETVSKLQEPAVEAAREIKATATEAAEETAEHARSAASEAASPLQQD